MKRHTKAVLSVASVEVSCPSCHEPIPNWENGSHLWAVDMLPAEDENVECDLCHKALTIPARPSRVPIRS